MYRRSWNSSGCTGFISRCIHVVFQFRYIQSAPACGKKKRATRVGNQDVGYSVIIKHQQSSNHHRSSSQGTVALNHGIRVFLGYYRHWVVGFLFMVPSFSYHKSVSPRTRSVWLEASSSEARCNSNRVRSRSHWEHGYRKVGFQQSYFT